MSDGTTATATGTEATATTTEAASTAAASTTTEATTAAATTAAAATEAAATTATTSATAATDWRAGITDPELKEFASRIASPADAVKVARDLRVANSSMIRVPGKDASAEDRAKFNKAIGVPEKPEDYKFDIGREPTDADKALQGELAKVFHENGVPASAVTAVSKAVSELAAAQTAEQERVAVKAREQTEVALKREWGADYDKNVNLAKRAVTAFAEVKGHPEALEFFDKTMVNGQKLGDHPVILRMFGNIGRRMGEGDFIGAVGAGDRQSLLDERTRIMNENPPGTPKYADRAVQARLAEINEALFGNAPVVGRGRSA